MIDSSYITLAHARNELLVLGETVDSLNDAELIKAVREASRAIEAVTGYQFAPSVEDVVLNSYGTHIDDSEGILTLPQPMVSFSSVMVNVDTHGENGTELVYETDYLYDPYGRLSTFALKRTGTDVWGETLYYERSIHITGVVAYRPGYGRAWRPLSALSAGINNSVLTIPVTATHGARFSPGMVIRIGNEFLNVESIDDDDLTVPFRGDNNNTATSTAAAHSTSDVIYVWQPHHLIEKATARTATLYYKRRGVTEESTFDGVMDRKFPTTIVPKDALDMLTSLSDRRSATP